MNPFLKPVVIVLAFTVSHGVVLAEDLPEAYPIERYESLLASSPFSLATPEVAPPPAEPPKPKESFADNLVLVGMGAIGDDQFVTVMDKKSNQTRIISFTPDEEGIKLLSMSMTQDPLKASAVLQKGDEQARVQFDSALLAAAAPQPASPSPARSANPPNLTRSNSRDIPSSAMTPDRMRSDRPNPRIIRRPLVIPNRNR